MFRYVLRNSWLPQITALGITLGAVINGNVLVERLGGALASLPFATWELMSSAVRVPDLLGWLLLVYLAVFVTFIGFAVWFWGLRALPAAQAGALMFLQPLSGLILAVLILGDRPTPLFLVGCGLVLAGVYLAAGQFPRRYFST